MSMVLIWYCGRCRGSYRSDPRLATHGCQCATPIPQDFGPTKVWADFTGRFATTRRLNPVPAPRPPRET